MFRKRKLRMKLNFSVEGLSVNVTAVSLDRHAESKPAEQCKARQWQWVSKVICVATPTSERNILRFVILLLAKVWLLLGRMTSDTPTPRLTLLVVTCDLPRRPWVGNWDASRASSRSSLKQRTAVGRRCWVAVPLHAKGKCVHDHWFYVLPSWDLSFYFDASVFLLLLFSDTNVKFLKWRIIKYILSSR